MNIADLVRECLRDPLGSAVLSYLLGSAMCGAWTLATESLRRVLTPLASGAYSTNC